MEIFWPLGVPAVYRLWVVSEEKRRGKLGRAYEMSVLGAAILRISM
jgi:hypothetical protein